MKHLPSRPSSAEPSVADQPNVAQAAAALSDRARQIISRSPEEITALRLARLQATGEADRAPADWASPVVMTEAEITEWLHASARVRREILRPDSADLPTPSFLREALSARQQQAFDLWADTIGTTDGVSSFVMLMDNLRRHAEGASEMHVGRQHERSLRRLEQQLRAVRDTLEQLHPGVRTDLFKDVIGSGTPVVTNRLRALRHEQDLLSRVRQLEAAASRQADAVEELPPNRPKTWDPLVYSLEWLHALWLQHAGRPATTSMNADQFGGFCARAWEILMASGTPYAEIKPSSIRGAVVRFLRTKNGKRADRGRPPKQGAHTAV
ncbi:hypothetical protein [Sabulicella rubraurantiaca]|uniref:hypothetical protein n=1 Tax=Sabulicella rubraurantiaca TaxID=2811429 RepID=UPI001A967C22|nr:hypothetical protein [Sabulicella rubraurantiaca]